MRTVNRITRFIMVVFLCTAFFHTNAQPFNLNDKIQPVELSLIDYKKGDAKEKGHINVTTVTQEEDTMYFFVKGLSMYSPAYFGITAEAGSSPITVNLNKENWHQANQSGETDDKGYWHSSFRTEGDFGIMVVPTQKPAKYTLVTWVGDEAKDVGVSSPFKEGADMATGSSGNFFTKNWIYILGGTVIVVLLLIIFLKRKK